jgi:hypothetical protein
MRSTLRRLAARLAVVLLVVIGTGVTLTGTALAYPTSCTHGITGPSVVGSYAGWARCWAGTGYYRAAGRCDVVGEIWTVYGPWLYRKSTFTGTPEKSYIYCPAGAPPTTVWVQTKN